MSQYLMDVKTKVLAEGKRLFRDGLISEALAYYEI